MKIILKNEKELIIDYFSEVDSKLLIRTSFAAQEELEQMFTDKLITDKIVFSNGEEQQTYGHYTECEYITKFLNTGMYEICLSQLGRDTGTQLRELEEELRKVKEEKAALEEEVTNLQMALVEVYEAMGV